MTYEKDNLENKIEDLRQELEHFEQEKERVRKIIGQIGGVPKPRTRLINILFIVLIVVTLVVSAIGGSELRLLMIEIATVAISIKILYMMHRQMKVDHFKFWILSSLEWRINEITRMLREMQD